MSFGLWHKFSKLRCDRKYFLISPAWCCTSLSYNDYKIFDNILWIDSSWSIERFSSTSYHISNENEFYEWLLHIPKDIVVLASWFLNQLIESWLSVSSNLLEIVIFRIMNILYLVFVIIWWDRSGWFEVGIFLDSVEFPRVFASYFYY